MKIFTADQIRQWDQYTIQHEPIASVDLMERAAAACTDWILQHCDYNKTFHIFCGNGNNGGDGLAIARMLINAQINTKIYILKPGKRSEDCAVNYKRLVDKNYPVKEIENEKDFPFLPQDDIIVDALFGTGLNKPLEGTAAALVHHLNKAGASIISIDVPSGLYTEETSAGNAVINATTTLSFQCYKKGFMMAENADKIGEVHILDIGLDKNYYQQTTSNFSVIDEELVQSIYQPRKKFAHKYNFGHALLFAGSNNMMGAAVLCAEACLRSGAGLVTVHCKAGTGHVIQTALPEAIVSTENEFEKIGHKKAAIGIGPGLEINDENSTLLKAIISSATQPLVIDASALSLLAAHLPLLKQRSSATILTPHTGEFEKLFGKAANDFDRINLAMQKACEHNCYIVLKGHHTLIACPGGTAWFNNTGNSGMATAGSGDVLTGIITGLLAQGYMPEHACVLGVYLHGYAGDMAAIKLSAEAMIAGDITRHIGAAYLAINKNSTH